MQTSLVGVLSLAWVILGYWGVAIILTADEVLDQMMGMATIGASVLSSIAGQVLVIADRVPRVMGEPA